MKKGSAPLLTGNFVKEIVEQGDLQKIGSVLHLFLKNFRTVFFPPNYVNGLEFIAPYIKTKEIFDIAIPLFALEDEASLQPILDYFLKNQKKVPGLYEHNLVQFLPLIKTENLYKMALKSASEITNAKERGAYLRVLTRGILVQDFGFSRTHKPDFSEDVRQAAINALGLTAEG